MLQAIILVTILIEAVLAVALLKTGRGVLLFAMIGVLVVAAGVYGIDVLIVSDEERVAESLYGICHAMEADDQEAVLSYIAPRNLDTRNRAIWAMDQGIVDSWTTRGLEIKINEVEFPRTAKVGFIGTISGRYEASPDLGSQTAKLRFVLTFEEQEDGQWLIIDHSVDMDLMKSIEDE